MTEPPEVWEPKQRGLVKIKSTGEVGTVIGHLWNKAQVRAIGGEIRWEVDLDDLAQPTDAERLSAQVRAVNSHDPKRSDIL
ncbi:hypothetical protein ACFYZT_24605 [Streptomyces sp. NPDC001591]|uniref:hypothetical protein n=1 Tax=Streptomyces sp. NPDC001591 TaxID=3364589 RepID=UPI00368501AD